ncbi:MAG: hypothetical protein C0524_02880 [Rhodobacter sp.]|nr:hypothetical protein [Rhodobacter sp.]
MGAIGDFLVIPWLQPVLPAVRYWQEAAEAFLPVSPQGLAAQRYSPHAWAESSQNPLEPAVRDLDLAQVCSGDGPRLFVSVNIPGLLAADQDGSFGNG